MSDQQPNTPLPRMPRACCFGRRRAGTGSGWLGDYLDDLPGVGLVDEPATADQTIANLPRQANP